MCRHSHQMPIGAATQLILTQVVRDDETEKLWVIISLDGQGVVMSPRFDPRATSMYTTQDAVRREFSVHTEEDEQCSGMSHLSLV